MSADPIVDALVAGTARRGTPTSAPSALGVEILADTRTSPELRLLHAAGARAIERRAGKIARDDLPAPTAADPDLWPPCRPRAAALVAAMLSGTHDALLPEALERLARAQRRLPHALLPRLLGARRPEIRKRAQLILGPRGAWLALQSPSFAWARPTATTIDVLAQTWAEGTSAPRREALEQGRAAAPELARGWLASTWDSEKAEDRAVFLTTLAVGLSDADEAFLEAALDDRSARVRSVAQGLLARLPGSALVARMTARATAMLQLRKSELRVDDPAPEPRDGLPDGADLRAARVVAVLAAVEVSAHPSRLGVTIGELMRAALRTTDASALADGWSRAALRAAHAAWAEALWDFWASADDKVVDRSLASEHMLGLLGVLPREAAVTRLCALLDRPGARADRPIGAFLVALTTPWPKVLTERYLTAVLRSQDAVSPRASELMSALAHAVRAIDAPDLTHATTLLPAGGGEGPWRHSIAEALDLITIRREILEETRP